jgi:hypothetical protein
MSLLQCRPGVAAVCVHMLMASYTSSVRLKAAYTSSLRPQSLLQRRPGVAAVCGSVLGVELALLALLVAQGRRH